MSLDLRQAIVRPIVTEKSSAAYQLRGVHVRGAPGVDEAPDPEALEQLFGVKVTGVWTLQMRAARGHAGADARHHRALEEGDRDAA